MPFRGVKREVGKNGTPQVSVKSDLVPQRKKILENDFRPRRGTMADEPEADLAMLANADLRDRGPRYTETPADPYAADAPFVAEPWNAVTASFFVFIALAWLWRIRGRARDFPFLVMCLPILLAGGIGGTLYHGLRTRQAYFLLDVIPIQLLALAGSVFIAIGLWGHHRWLTILGIVGLHLSLIFLVAFTVQPWAQINASAVHATLIAVAFVAVLQIRPTYREKIWKIFGVLTIAFPLYFATSIVLFSFFDVRYAVNMNYAALATLVVLPIVVRLAVTKFRHGSWFVAGLVAFVMAWFFRLVDQRMGIYMPMGTHWLWHTFGAISTALVIEYFYRVEAER
jgi:hypothetical protein